MKKYILLICLFVIHSVSFAQKYFIEAEGFNNLGGWVMDNQSMDQMGSPYLLAHGMGVPIEDAQTTLSVKQKGTYYVWVRTRDWVKRWNQTGSPGKFQLEINNKKLSTLFGTEQADWHWQKGGSVTLKKGANTISLHDLTGFNGRCDAIYFTKDKNEIPPHEVKELSVFRKKILDIRKPSSKGTFDLVVVGGGIAGISTAVSAARLGCKVALIQNRLVLGGNNSSEVRVGLSGHIMQKPYPNLGYTVDELGVVGYWNEKEAVKSPNDKRSKEILKIIQEHPEKIIHNAGPYANYEDEKKLQLIEKEKNISLFLNVHIFDVKMKGNQIKAVIGRDNLTGKEYTFDGTLFTDCTGDGSIGYLAGADYRMGRESKAETGEERAPEKADQLVMGTSVQWYAVENKAPSTFPDCPWGLDFNDQTCQKTIKGDWTWETGLRSNQITEIEYIRDYGLRAVYGNWSYLKNQYKKKNSYENHKLEWVAYIGGKRESRRLLGDVILKEQDLLQQTKYDDATFTTTWGIDLHYPDTVPGMTDEPFLTYCDVKEIKPYAVPYRCLYSRNVINLFMAGRNISVTHVALGTIRVMRTGGQMGEVVGMAASLCKKHDIYPRNIYQNHLPDLKELMQKGIGKSGFPAAKL